MAEQFKAKPNSGYLGKNNFKEEDWQDDFRCIVEITDEVIEKIAASKHATIGLREYKNDKGSLVRKVSVFSAKKPEPKEQSKANGYQKQEEEIPF